MVNVGIHPGRVVRQLLMFGEGDSCVVAVLVSGRVSQSFILSYSSPLNSLNFFSPIKNLEVFLHYSAISPSHPFVFIYVYATKNLQEKVWVISKIYSFLRPQLQEHTSLHLFPPFSPFLSISPTVFLGQVCAFTDLSLGGHVKRVVGSQFLLVAFNF